jgi:hypothetical protein
MKSASSLTAQAWGSKKLQHGAFAATIQFGTRISSGTDLKPLERLEVLRHGQPTPLLLLEGC